jgi:hypothetical protein
MKYFNRGTNLPFFKAIFNNINKLDRVKSKPFPAFNGSLTFAKPILFFGLILFLQAFSMAGWSQTSLAKENIDTLKKGIIIVVIPTYDKKIEALEEMQMRGTINQKRYSRMMRDTKWERDSFQMEIFQAMKTVYAFSDYAFLADTNLKPFMHGDWSRVVYPSAYQDDHKRTRIYFLRRGETENGAEALLVCDNKLNPLTKPFPYYVRLNGFVSIFESFFKSSPIKWKSLVETVGKLNKRLEEFYEKMN